MQLVHDFVMELEALDLNLLRVLDAVLETRHVTRAARRLGLSQSAVSHALARLRATFDDPLLVRAPGGLVPTARAEALHGPLRQALLALDRALAPPETFDARTSRRVFRFGAADYAQFVVLPALMSHLAREAPGVSLWTAAAAGFETVSAALANGELDLYIGVWNRQDAPPGLYERRLFDERFVCIVREDHPTVRDTLTLEQFVALQHAFIAPRGSRGGAVDDALARLGLERHIAVAIPHFLVMPHIIAQTDLVLTVAARVAHAFARTLPLRILAPPLDLARFEIRMVWHERSHLEPAHAWLRETMARLAVQFATETPAAA